MKIKPAAFGAAVFLFVAAPNIARATIYSGTFSGVITDGVDQNNYFGFGVDANLAGLVVTGDFSYNTSAGGIVVGDELGTSGPTFPLVIFAEVFVGGSSNPVYTFADDNGDVSFTNNNRLVLQGDDDDSSTLDGVLVDIGTGGPAFGGSGLGQSFDLIDPAIGSGNFFESADFSAPITQGDFTITAAAANNVPEPASGVLLAAGLATLAFCRCRV